MTASIIDWLNRHWRACLWTLAIAAGVLRGLLAFYSPWAFGYVWDLYYEAIQRLYATGHLPASTDCWECWQPPLLYLASWPLYAMGHAVYPTSPWPDDYALRFVGIIPILSGLATLYYTYRLLQLLDQRRGWLALGFGLVAGVPVLFFSTYSIEPDILLAGLLSAFTYYLMRWHLDDGGASAVAAVRLGVLAGLAAETKYNGLIAAAAGTFVMLAHARPSTTRQRALAAAATFMAVTIIVGGWKYVDNERRYGTPLFAVGDATSAFTLTPQILNTRYEFTTFRLPWLYELTRPDALEGMLDQLPVYRSFWTTLHGLTWGDMGFFTNPFRHGTRYPFYNDRHVPPWLAFAVIVGGIVPNVLAIAGLLITCRHKTFMPLTIMCGVGWAVFLQYVLSQPAWGIKAKYLAGLLPVYGFYVVVGLRWVCRAAPGWLSATVLAWTIALIIVSNVYLLAFAVG